MAKDHVVCVPSINITDVFVVLFSFFVLQEMSKFSWSQL